jgi:hypothetical protein
VDKRNIKSADMYVLKSVAGCNPLYFKRVNICGTTEYIRVLSGRGNSKTKGLA